MFFWYSASSILLRWQHLLRNAGRCGLWCSLTAPCTIDHQLWHLSQSAPPPDLVCFLLETPCVDKIPKDILRNCHVECWMLSAPRFILIYLQVPSLAPNRSHWEPAQGVLLTLWERRGMQTEITRKAIPLKWYHLMLREHLDLHQTSENNTNILMKV